MSYVEACDPFAVELFFRVREKDLALSLHIENHVSQHLLQNILSFHHYIFWGIFVKDHVAIVTAQCFFITISLIRKSLRGNTGS